MTDQVSRATKGVPLDDDALSAILGRRITDAISFDTEEREPQRIRAIEYLNRRMPDTPHEEGRSKVKTSELADNIGWMMPGLMAMFAGAGGVVDYEATAPEEEKQAKDATEYVQWVFANDVEGFRFLWTWFRDALEQGNGVAKAWFEDLPPKVTKQQYENLTVEQITQLMGDENSGIEISGAEKTPEGLINVELTKSQKRTRLQVAAVPPEEFLINRDAKSVKDAVIVGHRMRKTRSDLIKEGYDKAEVDLLPGYEKPISDQTDEARHRGLSSATGTAEQSADYVEYFEVFTQIDMDGDGIAEMYRICAAGSSEAPKILEKEPWDDECPPYIDLPCEITPHTWQGRSISDAVMDDQQVNTVVTRSLMDSLYQSVVPDRAVDTDKLRDPDELFDRKVGNVIRTKGDPNLAIRDLEVPFTGQYALAVLQYNKAQLQARVGVSATTPALDGDALVPKTATASQIEHDENYAKVQVIARTFAETGVRDLFALILKLIVRHQDQPRAIKVKKQWVSFDPRTWNDELKCTINVGMGTGSRERDLEMLGRIGAEQDKVIAELGPQNPVVPMSMWISTRQKMVVSAGLRNPEQFFADVSDDEFAQFMAQKQQNAPPDPKMIAAQGKIQTDQIKAQNDLNVKQQKNQGDFVLKSQEMNLEAQLSAEQMAMDAKHADTNIRGPSSL